MIFLNMMTICAALKCISFFVVANQINDCITAIKKHDIALEDKEKYFKDHVISRENFEIIHTHQKVLEILKLKDFLAFILMPTLCFQITYPRTNKIRPLFLAKTFIYFIVSLMLLLYASLTQLHRRPVHHADHQLFLRRVRADRSAAAGEAGTLRSRRS